MKKRFESTQTLVEIFEIIGRGKMELTSEEWVEITNLTAKVSVRLEMLENLALKHDLSEKNTDQEKAS